MPGPAEASELVLLQRKEEKGDEGVGGREGGRRGWGGVERQRETGMSTGEAMQEHAKPLLFTMSKVTGLGVSHLLWVLTHHHKAAAPAENHRRSHPPGWGCNGSFLVPFQRP